MTLARERDNICGSAVCVPVWHWREVIVAACTSAATMAVGRGTFAPRENVLPLLNTAMFSLRTLVLFLLVCFSLGGLSSWFGSNQEDDSSVLVSPIVNRELIASVVAHDWPFTIDNVVCEAWAYHYSDWDFMDSLVAKLEEGATTLDSEGAAVRLVVEATTLSTDKRLLEYALSLRAYSPQCELHRGLARQTLLLHNERGVTLDAFVVSGAAILTSVSDLATCTAGAEHELLPGEVPRQGTSDAPVVILYANMTTVTFVEWYNALVKGGIPFVVRHLGHVWYEEVGGTPTVLQGYGVRLDIRNVEYRVFDDRDEKPAETNAMINVTSLSSLSTQFLAGVNVSALGLDKDKALALQAELYKMHDAQQLHAQIIPPSWQRRKLSLQAAQAVASSSSDVLMTLQDVSQNLPSVASTLVHVEIPEILSELAEQMEGLLARTNGAALFVNGIRVPIDRPSFNVFEFLNTIKSEQTKLENMQERLSPYLSIPALRQVQRAWSNGADALNSNDIEEDEETSDDANVFRIDVGRGWKNAVLYVNDIEKDEEYENWPRSIQNMMFAMQYGAPPSVRRNIFTVLAVVDPLLDEGGNHGLSLASQLMQGQYPARLGVLLVNQEDLNECAKWIKETNPPEDEPCPVNHMFTPGSTPNMEMLDIVEASTQAAYNILAHVIQKYGMMASPYMQYWIQSIAQYKEKQGGDDLTVNDLIRIHAQLMAGMQVMSMDEAVDEAMEAFKGREKDDVPTYGKALRFALNKGLKPGMSFINGRPLPSGGDENTGNQVGEIFMQEQHHIMKLIMDGVITDSSPKSVYAKLLTGERVFAKVHPLLSNSQDEKDAYVALASGFGPESLLVPEGQQPTESPEAIFLVEAVADTDSSDGRKFAADFVATMNSMADSVAYKAGMTLAYRILPSTISSASSSLCSILTHANSFDAASLIEVLKLNTLAEMSTEDILKAIPAKVNAVERASILADTPVCSSASYLEKELPPTPFITANGRVFSPEDGSLKMDDVELLLNLELGKAKGITKLLVSDLSFKDNVQYDAVAQASAFLAEQQSKSKDKRSDMESMVLNLEKAMGIESNPIRFSWNNEDDGESLKVSVFLCV
jgi:UDP-glucose:glycoprotein glucosyltransferase